MPSGNPAFLTAAQMADGARTVFDADIGLATTGWAEPDAENRVAAPHVAWALSAEVDGHVESTAGWAEVTGHDRAASQAAIDAAMEHAGLI